MEQSVPREFNNYSNNTPIEEYQQDSFINQSVNDTNTIGNNYYNQTQSNNNNYYPYQIQEQNYSQYNNELQIQNSTPLIQNINQNLNEIVRQRIMSRGTHLGRSQSAQYVKSKGNEAKRILLDNIQSQLNLKKTAKLEELERKRAEDEKYLKEMENSFPFGRGGGGAPIRDKNGMVVASRRNLISDPKYNLISINVDDDYDEVWGKGKRFGLVNFKNRSMNMQNSINSNQMNNNNNININPLQNAIQRQFFSNTIPRNYKANQMSPNYPIEMNSFQSMRFNDNNYQVNNKYNNPPLYNYNNNNNNNDYYDENQYQFQPQRSMRNINYINRPYSTNVRGYNQNSQMFNGNHNNVIEPIEQKEFNDNPPIEINNKNTINGSNGNRDINKEETQINLSYYNYGLDEESKRINKESYRDDLLYQIQEKQNKILLEKRKKAQEELEEEDRLKRENMEIERRLQEERNRMKKYQREKNVINNIKEENNEDKEEETEHSISNKTPQKEVDESEKRKQEELESRLALNNQILRLRDQIRDHQESLYNQINKLKQRTENANMQRYEALKEIHLLKMELSRQREDEELRRKYINDVISSDNNKISGMYNQSHLPDRRIERVIIPMNRERETIKHNRFMQMINLSGDKMKGNSKFIDVNTRNIFNGEDPSEMRERNESIEDDKISNLGYEVPDEYGNMISNIKDNNKNERETIIEESEEEEEIGKGDNKNKLKDDIKENIQSNDDSEIELNKIYSKNIRRLNYLNNLEDNIENNIVTIGGKKYNYDDFIINNTYNFNY